MAREKFFLYTSGNGELQNQLRTVLSFGGFDAVSPEGNPLEEMRGCAGGVLVCSSSSHSRNEWLVLGAAAVLLKDRLVLLRSDEGALPTALENIPYIRLQGRALDWEAALLLMRYLSS